MQFPNRRPLKFLSIYSWLPTTQRRRPNIEFDRNYLDPKSVQKDPELSKKEHEKRLKSNGSVKICYYFLKKFPTETNRTKQTSGN